MSLAAQSPACKVQLQACSTSICSQKSLFAARQRPHVQLELERHAACCVVLKSNLRAGTSRRGDSGRVPPCRSIHPQGAAVLYNHPAALANLAAQPQVPPLACTNAPAGALPTGLPKASPSLRNRLMLRLGGPLRTPRESTSWP